MKDKTVLVWHYGIFFNLVKRLSKEFKTVYSYVPRQSNFPTLNVSKIGTGYPNIVTCDEDDAWKKIHEVDLVVFPDTGDAGLVRFLRKKGYRVYGSEFGEKLELDRSFLKEELKKIGLPVNKYKVFTDVDKLRSYLMENENKFIKISYLRGIAESYHHTTWDATESWWLDLSKSLGIFRHDFQEVIVEEPIETKVEVGTDRFWSGKKFSPYLLQGFEIKNKGYLAKLITEDKLPKLLKDIDDKVANLYKKFDIRSTISTEIRVADKNTGYYIDSTQRLGYPPSCSMMHGYDNIGEMMYKMAGNEEFEAVENYRYVCEINLYSEELKNDWVQVNFDKKYDDNVYLTQSCIYKDKHYVIPYDDSNLLGSVVCGADDMEEAMEECLEIASKIEADGLYYDEKIFDKVKEQLKTAKTLDVSFKG